ncbi:MAG: hypothetical protein Q8K60_04980 [Parachlamydiaceae bacterium]|nr:hypothetical protein [Parachlamydiaceae bacterium]
MNPTSPLPPSQKIIEPSMIHRLLSRTRDFREFRFKILELSEDEQNDSFCSRCLKFETPKYIAYIPAHFQNYIKEEDIYSENDTDNMRDARRLCWGGPLTRREAQIFRQTHTYEASQMDKVWASLDAKDTKNNKKLYSKVFQDNTLNSYENKYSKRSFFKILIFGSNSIFLVMTIATLVAFIVTGIFLFKKKLTNQI